MQQGAVRVAGHEKDRKIGVLSREFSRKLLPSEGRHHYICEQKVNRPGPFIGDFQRMFAVGRDQNLVATFAQELRNQVSQ